MMGKRSVVTAMALLCVGSMALSGCESGEASKTASDGMPRVTVQIVKVDRTVRMSELVRT